MILLVEFDGACEPRNPGGVATGGWLVFGIVGYKESLLFSGLKAFYNGGPNATNNAAEWCALGFALRGLTEHGLPSAAQSIMIRGDSQLVIKQLTGEWKCRQERMQRFRDRCLQLLDDLSLPWQAKWVPREQNERADALSRKAYEAAVGKKFPERRRKT